MSELDEIVKQNPNLSIDLNEANRVRDHDLKYQKIGGDRYRKLMELCNQKPNKIDTDLFAFGYSECAWAFLQDGELND